MPDRRELRATLRSRQKPNAYRDMSDRNAVAPLALQSRPERPGAAQADVLAFLFTDIEGSSLRWLNHRVAMQPAVGLHDALLTAAIAAHGGHVFKTTGDGFYAAFALPADALNAAVAAQQALAARNWSDVGGLAVRMAVHAGTAHRRDDDYFGPALNRVARLLPLGHGGQILLTASAAELVVAERDHLHPLRMLGTHPLDDPSQPVGVYQVDVPGLRCDFPALRVSDARRTNLPHPSTPLIGREGELAQVRQLLDTSRLVTLAGAGGVGKTRLAQDAGAQRLDHHVDGVWMVELAPIADPALVASTTATALRIESSGELAPLDLLANRVRDKSMLLIIDNCEHVIDAAATMVDALLAAAPGLRVLATSQEPLGVSGEQVLRVPSLSVPGERVSQTELLESPAVRLFVERAKAADAHFHLDHRTTGVVAAICRRLDGIALAIEMAAARASTLGVDALASRLDERFRLLTRGARTALPRQQTLRATLDWSHGLLDEREGSIFRRLAVFAGGFTVDAAAEVVADGTIDAFDAMDHLSHLVARSLVATDAAGEGRRLRLLETTRAYAFVKLAEAGETPVTKRRHALYCRALFDRSFDEWSLLSDQEWRARYGPERDNLRAALDWAFGPEGDAQLGVALLAASSRLWYGLSLFSEARERFDAAAALVTNETDPAVAARFWLGVGMLWYDGSADKTTASLETAIALLRTIGDSMSLGEALARLGSQLATPLATRARGAAMLEESRVLLERAGRPRHLARYYIAESHLQVMQGNEAVSNDLQQRALELFRAAGADCDALMAISNLADMVWSRGDLDEAIRVMRETVQTVRESPDATRSSLGNPLANLAGVLTEAGQLDEAREVAREAIPILREAGSHWGYFDHIALRLALQGQLDDAARLEGFADAAFLAQGEYLRQPNESRLRAKLLDVLREKLPPERLTALLAEGARLSDDDACRLAMETSGSEQ